MFLTEDYSGGVLLPAFMPGVLAAVTGFDRWKLEGHRDRLLEEKSNKGRMDQHEYGWAFLSISASVRSSEAAALFNAFENVRQEVWEFNVDHWSFIGKAIPDSLVKWIGRHWGWHRMIYGNKRLSAVRGR